VRRLLLVAAATVWMLVLAQGATAALPMVGPTLYGSMLEEEWVTAFPRPAGSNAPTVIIIHGGAFREQPSLVPLASQAKALQNAGFAAFVVAFPQARPKGDGEAFPRMPDAIKRATKWVIEHTAEFGGNPNNIEYNAESSGSLLAGISAEQLNTAAPHTIDGILTSSGPENLWTMVQLGEAGEVAAKHARTMERVLNCTALSLCSESLAAEWSPVDHISAQDCTPWMIASYEQDEVPLSQQLEMVAAGEAAGCPIGLLVVPGRGHTPPLQGAGVDFLREH
jgi:acetyl esterase/lipase